MFEWPVSGVTGLREAAAAVRSLDRSVDDATRIDRLRALEDLKAACAAAQARDAADLAASRRAEQAAAGVPVAEQGRGVGAEVALARRTSPHRGGRLLGLATALVHEMPHTLSALSTGRIDEWRATVLVRETAVLSREDRSAVDEELLGTPQAVDRILSLGDRALAARAQQVAYRLDARSVAERARRAVTERRVTVRPAPDTMAYLTALLPVRDAVTAQVALARAADAARADGDQRTRGQLMADTLSDALAATAPFRELTWAQADTPASAGAGSTAEEATSPSPDGEPAHRPARAAVALRLVMTDRALLAGPEQPGREEPARLDGYGTVTAAWARELVATALEDGAGVWVRRLLTDAVGGLAGMDSRSRIAPTGLADLIRTRDLGTCRTPRCDAPARHVDHVTPHARGGPTTERNGQSLCEACNYTKELSGWSARSMSGPAGGVHTVVTTTPTGHTYRSTSPPLPGALAGAGAGADIDTTFDTSPRVPELVLPEHGPPVGAIERFLVEQLDLLVA